MILLAIIISDDIRNKLNSVTVSLMLKLAYEMNWHDAHSVFEEIKSVPFASIRVSRVQYKPKFIL